MKPFKLLYKPDSLVHVWEILNEFNDRVDFSLLLYLFKMQSVEIKNQILLDIWIWNDVNFDLLLFNLRLHQVRFGFLWLNVKIALLLILTSKICENITFLTILQVLGSIT